MKDKLSKYGFWILMALFFIGGCYIVNVGYNNQSTIVQYIGGGVIVLPWIGFLLYNKVKQSKVK